jgi:plastocyanin domain-containing protein
LDLPATRPDSLNLHRQQTAASREMVSFLDVAKRAKLPTRETVPIELLPEETGDYDFACQMGMFRGKLIVA